MNAVRPLDTCPIESVSDDLICRPCIRQVKFECESEVHELEELERWILSNEDEDTFEGSTSSLEVVDSSLPCSAASGP